VGIQASRSGVAPAQRVDQPDAKMREHVRYSNDKDREALQCFLKEGLMPGEEEDAE